MHPAHVHQYLNIVAQGSIVINSLPGFYRNEQAQEFAQFAQEASELLEQGKLEWEHVEIVYDAYHEMVMAAHAMLSAARYN